MAFSNVTLAKASESQNNSSLGFQLKCYVDLANGKSTIYTLWTKDRGLTPSRFKKDILDIQVRFQSTNFNTSIVKVHECRYGNESFVNVSAIKLDEDRDL